MGGLPSFQKKAFGFGPKQIILLSEFDTRSVARLDSLNRKTKMKSVRILSVGILSVWIWGCNQTTEPASHQAGTRNVAPAVNALTKVAALKAGYGMSREAADSSFDFFDESIAQ